jgi:imidazolonepropionase-like amidohydrolase
VNQAVLFLTFIPYFLLKKEMKLRNISGSSRSQTDFKGGMSMNKMHCGQSTVSRRVRIGCLLAAVLLFWGMTAQSNAQSVEHVYAIRAGKVVTVTQGILEDATIVVRNGIIEAVGKKVAVPVEAEVISADSLVVYPGLIDAHTELALKIPKKKEEQPGSTQTQTTETDPRLVPNLLSPDKRSFTMLNPKDAKIAKIRETGITTALTVPAKGIFIGQSALINLSGSRAEEMVLKSPVAMHLGYDGQRGLYPSTLMAVIAFQRQTFMDAQHHRFLWDRYAKQKKGWKRPLPDESLDALLPVLRGEMVVIISANRENEIKRALQLADEFKLNILISGAVEGWRVKDLLRTRQKPVLVSLNFPKPESVTGYAFQLKIEGPSKEKSKKIQKKTGKGESGVKKKSEEPEKDKEKEAEMKDLYANAGLLHKAGIRFAFASGGLKKPEDFIKNIAKTIEHGLPKEVALRAVTIHPAEIFGVADQIGSIEEGKIANLIVATGDLFDKETKLRYVFVDGKKAEIKEKKKPKPGEKSEVNVTGIWDVTVSTPEGDNPATLTLTQTGSDVSGELSSDLGTVSLYDGTVSGTTITFSVRLPLGDEPVEVVFNGTVEGNTIEGTLDLGEMGQVEWNAVKPGFYSN